MTKIDDLWLYDQAQQAVAKIDNRLKTTPNRARLNKLHSFLTEQQAQAASLTKQIEAKGAALTRLTALCQDLERRLELELSEFSTMENDEECTAAEMTEARKSMEGLMDQITSARKDITDAISFLEKASTDYKETYAKAGKAKKEYDAVRSACEDEKAQAAPEREQAVAAADKLKEGIDPALLKRYTSIRSNYANPIATVENNQCSGCRMSLPTSIVKKVESGTGLVECENCGRILYNKQ